MPRGRIQAVIAFLVFFPAIAWLDWSFNPGELETEFREYEARGITTDCMAEYREERTFVLRVHDRILPWIHFLEFFQAEAPRLDIFWSLSRDPDFVDEVYPYYWAGTKRLVTRIKPDEIFDLRHWRTFYDEAEKLAYWDRDNIDGIVYTNELRVNFAQSRSVRRLSRYELVLRLDSGDFLSFREPIKKAIESYWSIGPYRVYVEWAAPGDFDATKLVYDPDDILNYVSFAGQELHLDGVLDDELIAHEAGHILGFDDHYFDYWRPWECSVGINTQPHDLMSISRTSNVLLGHWRILDKAYPGVSEFPNLDGFPYEALSVFDYGI